MLFKKGLDVKTKASFITLTSVLVNGIVIVFKIIKLYFYYTVPLVLRISTLNDLPITGYWQII